MTFIESIRTCFMKYADFNGRATLPEFWWFVLFSFLAGAALGLISQMLSSLLSLAILLPGLAVGARRLHDTDRSGWWQLLGLIPIVGWIILIVWCIQPANEPNRFSVPAP